MRRCSACRQICRDLTKDVCPACGGALVELSDDEIIEETLREAGYGQPQPEQRPPEDVANNWDADLEGESDSEDDFQIVQNSSSDDEGDALPIAAQYSSSDDDEDAPAPQPQQRPPLLRRKDSDDSSVDSDDDYRLRARMRPDDSSDDSDSDGPPPGRRRKDSDDSSDDSDEENRLRRRESVDSSSSDEGADDGDADDDDAPPPVPAFPGPPPLPPFPVQAPAAVVACPNSPKYEPNVWNDNGNVQRKTNCYAYACNDKGEGHPRYTYYLDAQNIQQQDDYRPQPGELCGNQYDRNDPNNCLNDCTAVKAAVACDSAAQPNHLGMIPFDEPKFPKLPLKPDELPPAKDGYYLVALAIAPGVDYHWYRQDDNGKWSHKPGSGRATNLDAAGNEIVNPRMCDRDGTQKGTRNGINYSKFCGYYYVPKCGMLTGTNTANVVQQHAAKNIN